MRGAVPRDQLECGQDLEIVSAGIDGQRRDLLSGDVVRDDPVHLPFQPALDCARMSSSETASGFCPVRVIRSTFAIRRIPSSKRLHDARSCVIRQEDINDIAAAWSARDEVDGCAIAAEAMRLPGPSIDRRHQPVAERLKCAGCVAGNTTGGLDAQDHVDVIRRSDDPDPGVYAVELRHETAYQRPVLVGEYAFDLRNAGPWLNAT